MQVPDYLSHQSMLGERHSIPPNFSCSNTPSRGEHIAVTQPLLYQVYAVAMMVVRGRL